jgi:hypothetical protein
MGRRNSRGLELSYKPVRGGRGRGRWYKKVGGQAHYFGWGDGVTDRDGYQAALRSYREWLDSRKAARARSVASGLTRLLQAKLSVLDEDAGRLDLDDARAHIDRLQQAGGSAADLFARIADDLNSIDLLDGGRPMGTKKYHVTLTPEERAELGAMVNAGTAAARKLTHARVLLKADEAEGGPAWADGDIAEALGVGLSTVARVRERFVEDGTAAALVPRPTSRAYARKLDGAGGARLVKLACSAPPDGRGRWTLRLPADRMVALGHAEDRLSYETVRRALKKTCSSRG